MRHLRWEGLNRHIRPGKNPRQKTSKFDIAELPYFRWQTCIRYCFALLHCADCSQQRVRIKLHRLAMHSSCLSNFTTESPAEVSENVIELSLRRKQFAA